MPASANLATGDGRPDLAHELGLGVGLPHHGDDAFWSVSWKWRGCANRFVVNRSFAAGGVLRGREPPRVADGPGAP